MRVERNDPCPCGSGAKFKKCSCGLREGAARPAQPRSKRVLNGARMSAWPMHIVSFGERKGLVIGHNAFMVASSRTFAAALLDFLRFKLGEPWLARARQLPSGQRHVIAEWIDALETDIRNAPDSSVAPDGTVERMPTGTSRALMSIADDLAQVEHCGRVPAQLLRRLRDRKAFQGARYELFIAGLMLRAGFRVFWRKPSKTGKTPDFEAHLGSTGERFLIEAKSIHRADALHGGEGARSDDEERRARAVTLFVDALSHSDDHSTPLLVFIDVNLPSADGRSPKEDFYASAIESEVGRRILAGEDVRHCAAVAMTNMGWYFHDSPDPAPGGTLLFRLSHATTPMSDEAQTRIGRAARESGVIPDVERDWPYALA